MFDPVVNTQPRRKPIQEKMRMTENQNVKSQYQKNTMVDSFSATPAMCVFIFQKNLILKLHIASKSLQKDGRI